MDLKYLKNIAAYIATAAFSILIILYIVYHMTGGFGNRIETFAAMYVTESELVPVDAYILRKEKVIYSASVGSVDYYFDNGEKVGVNDTVAAIYSGNDVRSELIRLDEKIRILKESNIADQISIADTASLDKRINELYTVIRQKTEQGDIDYAFRKKDELLVLLNKRQIIVKNVPDYNDQITVLLQERDSYKSGAKDISQTITVDSSGYFYTGVDGYENIFSSLSIDTMTIDDYMNAVNTEAEDFSGNTANGYAIGKLASDFYWYIACDVSYDQFNHFTEGKKYDVVFPYNSDRKINMTLYRVITEPNHDRVVLIFQSGILIDNFNFLRRQAVDIIQTSYSGYRVPVSAVRIIDGKKGVFILDGSIVKFREVEPIFEKDGYLIVAEKDASDTTHANRLGLYDMIITKGKDLYDGKVIG